MRSQSILHIHPNVCSQSNSAKLYDLIIQRQSGERGWQRSLNVNGSVATHDCLTPWRSQTEWQALECPPPLYTRRLTKLFRSSCEGNRVRSKAYRPAPGSLELCELKFSYSAKLSEQYLSFRRKISSEAYIHFFIHTCMHRLHTNDESWSRSQVVQKCNIIKLHRNGKVKLSRFYSYLTSTLNEGEWSASRPGRAFSPGKGPPVPIR
jgi:hypothetical protein